MTCKQIQACRVCGNKNLIEVLDLGTQALTGFFPSSINDSVTEGPLKLVKCHGDDEVCHLLQLQHTYELDELYGEHYGYRSGLNESMVRHLDGKVGKVLQQITLKAGDLVLDIGSNDGTTLGMYPKGEWDLVGIDPSGEKFIEFYEEGVQLIPDFFSADKVRQSMGDRKAKVVTSFSMFYDLENPVQFAKEIAGILAQDGIWVLEQSYMPEMMAQTSYDTVCHEHLEYYGLSQIQWITEKVGLQILDVEFNDINGGSFSVTVSLKDSQHQPNMQKITDVLAHEKRFKTLIPYEEFQRDVALSKEYLLNKIDEITKAGSKVVGLGASTKGNVILQYCGITPKMLPMIGEVNEDKYGKYTPGSLIPICSETEALEQEPDFILVLPWHFRKFFEQSPKFEKLKLIYPLTEQ